MATTTEKYYILKNEQGMFLQGLAGIFAGLDLIK